MTGWLAIGIAYSVLEYYLGRTDRVKANSTLELALHGVKIALGVILSKRK